MATTAQGSIAIPTLMYTAAQADAQFATAANLVFDAMTGGSVTAPANTAENTLATLTLPANSMGANGWIEIYAMWETNSNSNNKFGRIKFGGTAVKAFSFTSTQSAGQLCFLVNNNNTAAQKCITSAVTAPDVNSVGVMVSPAIDTTSAVSIIVTAQKSVAGDTMILHSCWFKAFKKA